MRILAKGIQWLRQQKPKVHKRHVLIITSVAILAVFAYIGSAHSALAGTDIILTPLSWLLYALMSFFGLLLSKFFIILIGVAQYNDFRNAAVIDTGWKVVRDVSNMFFIFVMLIIAFGTLFQVQKYRYNALLKNVVLMAVLINFSNTITFFFIDLMQVIALTFVNAIAGTLVGNITSMVGVRAILIFDMGNRPTGASDLQVFATALLAAIMLGITCLVVLLYALLFLIRIIALWLLTTLSPLAYLLSTFPGTAQYAHRWWSEFWKYATIGPVMAFMLWLALSVGAAGKATIDVSTTDISPKVNYLGGDISSGDNINSFLMEAGRAQNITNFLVAIIILVGGLTITAQFGVAGGQMAGKLAQNIQKTGVNVGKGTARLPFRAARGLAQEVYTKTPLQRVSENFAGGAMSRLAALNLKGQRIPFAARWAEKKQRDLNEMRKKRTEQRQKEMGALDPENTGDRRILSYWANQKVTDMTSAVNRHSIEQAQRRAPMTITDTPTRLKVVEWLAHHPRNLRELPNSQWFGDKDKGFPEGIRHDILNQQLIKDPRFQDVDVDKISGQREQHRWFGGQGQPTPTPTPPGGGGGGAAGGGGGGGARGTSFMRAASADTDMRADNRVTSWKNVLRNAQGAGDKQVYMGMDFRNPAVQSALGLTGREAGYSFRSAEDKEKAIGALTPAFRAQRMEALAKEGTVNPVEIERRVDDEVGQFQQGIRNADDVRMINTGGADNARHTARHERAHGQIKRMPDDQLETFYNQRLGASGGALLNQARTQWAGSKLNDTDLKREVLTEMMASSVGGAMRGKQRGAVSFEGVTGVVRGEDGKETPITPGEIALGLRQAIQNLPKTTVAQKATPMTSARTEPVARTATPKAPPVTSATPTGPGVTSVSEVATGQKPAEAPTVAGTPHREGGGAAGQAVTRETVRETRVEQAAPKQAEQPGEGAVDAAHLDSSALSKIALTAAGILAQLKKRPDADSLRSAGGRLQAELGSVPSKDAAGRKKFIDDWEDFQAQAKRLIENNSPPTTK